MYHGASKERTVSSTADNKNHLHNSEIKNLRTPRKATGVVGCVYVCLYVCRMEREREGCRDTRRLDQGSLLSNWTWKGLTPSHFKRKPVSFVGSSLAKRPSADLLMPWLHFKASLPLPYSFQFHVFKCLPLPITIPLTLMSFSIWLLSIASQVLKLEKVMVPMSPF